MKLKEFDRPHYEINPIFEVICQLRFHTILKISEPPVSFQDKIRNEYPDYRLDPVVPDGVFPMFIGASEVQHRFVSEDGVWQVLLAKDNISLTNFGGYTSFEDFSCRLDAILDAFDSEYSPSAYSRIGLRYRNLIARSVFPQIKSLEWKKLIPEYIAPELHDGNIGESKVYGFEKKIILQEDNEKINVFHVLQKMSGELHGTEFEDELAYIIDIDSYTEEKINDRNILRNAVQSFKQNIQNIFRYSISDELHSALGRTNSRKDKI